MPLSDRQGDEAGYVGLFATDAGAETERDLGVALAGGFDFIVAPLSLPREPGGGERPDAVVRPLASSVFLRRSSAWSSSVVGLVSPWLAPDSADPALRRASEAALRAELSWGAHLTLQACLLPLASSACANAARAVHSFLAASALSASVWLQLPLLSAAAEAAEADGQPPPPDSDSWAWWHAFRSLCDAHPGLGVCLEIGPTLPAGEAAWQRWLGEPLRCAVLRTDAFASNARGFPVLSPRHQALLRALLAQGVPLALRGEPGRGELQAGPARAPPPHPLGPYWDYLAWLQSRSRAGEATEQERVEAGYRDYLQAPLQPLMDNLESATYETFERDGVKYERYEQALAGAMADAPARPDGAPLIVVVAGAGRGPLVRAALAAARRAGGLDVRVYAVEKNPNACVHLRAAAEGEGWGARVAVCASDLRAWAPPEAAHIVVSELLGSFGDNELSPECLAGAERLLALGGVLIPQSYTSYLQPVCAAKLHAAARARAAADGAHGGRAQLETPYVVKLHSAAALADPLPVFQFDHPAAAADDSQPAALRAGESGPLSRHAELTFRRPADAPAALCHGFAGTFHAVLYKARGRGERAARMHSLAAAAQEVTLSIYPPTATPSMHSWFPIFFPLREPLLLRAGGDVQAHIWRACSASRVWYEWAVTQPEATALHNPGGRSYFVGL